MLDNLVQGCLTLYTHIPYSITDFFANTVKH